MSRSPSLTRLAVLTLALVAAGPRIAEAKLAPSKFAVLLAESELICRVRVTEAQVDRYRGHSVVEVVSVLKGEQPAGPIRLDFSGEVHDQVLKVVGEERLMFLKKVDGKWTGTHYGRSYWPLVPAADPALGLVTPIAYPVHMLRFEGRYARLVRPARLPPGSPKAEGMILLSAVEKAISDSRRIKR